MPRVGCKAELEFYARVDSSETTTTTAVDTMKVSINGKELRSLSNLDNSKEWRRYAADVTEYAGTTVTVRFDGQEDATLSTLFYLDDVEVKLS